MKENNENNKKNKKRDELFYIMAFYIICVTIGSIIALAYIAYTKNLKLKYVIEMVGGFLIMGLLFFGYYNNYEKKRKLLDQLFILDIYKETNNGESEHIRITEKNLLFKYRHTLGKYFYPKWMLFLISMRGQMGEMHIIRGKKQLSLEEENKIIDSVNELKENPTGDLTVDYKGNKKKVSSYDINKIFNNYSIKI